MKFRGLYTALITPFLEDGSLDQSGLTRLIERQLEAKVNGLVMLGTTGETPALTAKEKEKIIQVACSLCKGKIPVIVGTGSNSTQATIDTTNQAEKLGADAALIVTPYYNKPTQEGIKRHFTAVHQETNLPIIVYNIPGRTGVNIETETLCELLKLPKIVSVKEASGDISQMTDVLSQTRKIRPEFTVLSGDDALTLPLAALGGDGLVSVASNVIPVEMKQFVDVCLKEDFYEARQLQEELLFLFRALFLETNPIPVKEIMRMLELPAGPCRLPLPPYAEHLRLDLEDAYLFKVTVG